MSRTLRVLALARADITAIFDWLERRTRPGAVAWYTALTETLRRIGEHPEHYAVIAESRPRWNRDIRHALFKTPRGRRYRIVFEWTEPTILILRVRGPGQRPLRLRDLPNS